MMEIKKADKTNTENTDKDTAAAEPDRAQARYKTAFHIMTCITLLLFVFFMGLLLIQNYGKKAVIDYSEIAETYKRAERVVSATQAAELRINVNSATKIELTLLPGIGESRAQDIIDYRNEYGRFTEPEDLLNISGIGEVILENIRPYIVFDTED